MLYKGLQSLETLRPVSKMSETTLKYYDDSDFDVKELVNSHFSNGNIGMIEETMGFPTRVIHELVSTGNVDDKPLLHKE